MSKKVNLNKNGDKKIVLQPKAVMANAKVILKVGSQTKFFFSSEEKYEQFKEKSEPNLSILGKRTLLRR